MAKLRFESPNPINRLEFSIDQTAHFIFMADYDSSVSTFLFFYNICIFYRAYIVLNYAIFQIDHVLLLALKLDFLIL